MPELKISAPPFPNRKEHPFTASVRYRGMVIDVENLDGSVREGTDPNGKTWKTQFKGCHYGEIRGSLGTDGDRLDVYIKSNPDDGANRAYIIHQNFPRTHPTKGGQYDEDKVVLGVSSLEEARELYLGHYDRKDFLRSITEMPIEAFKRAAFGENKGEKVAEDATLKDAKEIGERIGIDWDTAAFPAAQFAKGLDVEREHGSKLGKDTDVGGDKDSVAGRIAWAHLKELPDYYTRLHKMEVAGDAAKEKKADADEDEGTTPVNKDTVNAWLRANPNPDDDKMHAFAESKGYDTHKLETYIYSLATKAVENKKVGSSFIRQKMREGGTSMNISKIKEAACKTPGKKIRSKGKGRGAGEGRGHGPRGVPIGAKGMAGRERDMSKKSEVTEAYEAGAHAALDDYLKEAAQTQKGFQTVLKKMPGSPPVMGAIPAPPQVSAPAGIKTAQGAQALGLNPGGGFGNMSYRGMPQQVQSQAVAGNAAVPTSQADQLSGASVASPVTNTYTPAAQPPVRQPQPLVAAAGGVPQIPTSPRS